jgi:hypothetical protein
MRMDLGWLIILIPVGLIFAYDIKNRKKIRKNKHLDHKSDEIEDNKRLEAVGMVHSSFRKN